MGARAEGLMDCRTFVRLMAAAPLARPLQIRKDLPPLRVVSSYSPASTPGCRVHTQDASSPCVRSSVDITTGEANDEVVREMMASGMRALTGAAQHSEAWRRFFDPSDIVGIKVNCGGTRTACPRTRSSRRSSAS